jgi:hypothetical protein
LQAHSLSVSFKRHRMARSLLRLRLECLVQWGRVFINGTF